MNAWQWGLLIVCSWLLLLVLSLGAWVVMCELQAHGRSRRRGGLLQPGAFVSTSQGTDVIRPISTGCSTDGRWPGVLDELETQAGLSRTTGLGSYTSGVSTSSETDGCPGSAVQGLLEPADYELTDDEMRDDRLENRGEDG